jgi:hypothetical protein
VGVRAREREGETTGGLAKQRSKCGLRLHRQTAPAEHRPTPPLTPPHLLRALLVAEPAQLLRKRRDDGAQRVAGGVDVQQVGAGAVPAGAGDGKRGEKVWRVGEGGREKSSRSQREAEGMKERPP